jgi:hypothetical protein
MVVALVIVLLLLLLYHQLILLTVAVEFNIVVLMVDPLFVFYLFIHFFLVFLIIGAHIVTKV